MTKVIVRSAPVFLFWLRQFERKEIILSVIGSCTLLGDIVRLYPQTLKMVTRYNLDLCYEAGYPLAVAAQTHNLDLGRFLEELNQAIEGPESRREQGF